MSFWTDFEKYVHTAVQSVSAEILLIAHKIKPLVVASADELAHLAVKAVIAEAPKVISGQEKLASAVSNLVTTLAKAGKSVAATTAEAAIQVAYNEIASHLPKTP